MKKQIQLGLQFVVILFLAGSCKNDILVPVLQLPANPCLPFFAYGYCDKISYYPGDIIKVYLQSKENVPLCKLDIYRLTGELAFSIASPLTVQQISANDPAVNGYGFLPTVEIKIPFDFKSGIYLIENQTPFIVKTKKSVDVLVVYPANTANAYDTHGGKSLYSIVDKPSFVSFLRPIPIQGNAAHGLHWFSSLKGFGIGFISDMDLDDYQNIRNAKIIVIVGHSEYWTRKAREHFDRFVNEGGNALVLSGNTMWWQVRYSNKHDQLIRYLHPANDPEENPLLKTINWNEASLQYSILSSIGADFPHGGYGLKNDNGWNGYKITTPGSPLLEGTGLKRGDIIDLPSGEYDGAPIKAFDIDGFPMLDYNVLNFKKIELIGFDKGSRFNKETIGIFIVFKRTEKSGIIVNAASYDWCSERGMGGHHGNIIKKITYNAVEKLLKYESVFSN